MSTHRQRNTETDSPGPRGGPTRGGPPKNKQIRKTTGQLSWLASQTLPDLSYDAFHLSTRLNKATYRDALEANKATKKALNNSVRLKFSRLGNIEDLKMEVYPNASLGNAESNLLTKSMMGFSICLSNNETKMSPLHWKSRIIEKVAPDIKTAETPSIGACFR